MKALMIALAVAVAAVSMTGCCNLRARTAVKPSCPTSNCAPAKVYCKTVEK